MGFYLSAAFGWVGVVGVVGGIGVLTMASFQWALTGRAMSAGFVPRSPVWRGVGGQAPSARREFLILRGTPPPSPPLPRLEPAIHHFSRVLLCLTQNLAELGGGKQQVNAL